MKTSQCTNDVERRVALFAGSFAPFTRGHEDIVRRALTLVDEVIVAIGVNSAKHAMMSIEARQAFIRSAFADEPRVRVLAYDGLTADFATECGARCLLRGVRAVADFESEMQLAEANRRLTGIETMLLFTRAEYAHVSSTFVRELLRYGRDVSGYVPAAADLSLLLPKQ